jgi:hypothetical protein
LKPANFSPRHIMPPEGNLLNLEATLKDITS